MPKRIPFYRRHQLRFECTGCGACCTGGAEDYVAVNRSEQERIRAFLRISKRWFRRRYIVKIDESTEGLNSAAGGSCVFLDATRRCTIYPVRPQQCRTYPFWPEVLRSHKAWCAEAKRCEGIGHGQIVPLRRLQAALKAARR
ncbi:MAG: YkgJ family cysteine cluster protein [Acidiferrobacterales bacterium]